MSVKQTNCKLYTHYTGLEVSNPQFFFRSITINNKPPPQKFWSIWSIIRFWIFFINMSFIGPVLTKLSMFKLLRQNWRIVLILMQLNTKWTSNLEGNIFYANKFLELVGRPNIVATTTQFTGGSWPPGLGGWGWAHLSHNSSSLFSSLLECV